MRSLVTGIVLLAAALLSNAASAGVVKPWEYVGPRDFDGHAGYVAQTSVRDDILKLVYSPGDDAFYLIFVYNGDTSFSEANAERAEIYIRTRREAEVAGRYSSDYVFQGRTRAVPDPDPNAPQIVSTELTNDDLLALSEHHGNEVMGVGYFTADETWKTYTFSSEGLWAAYQAMVTDARIADRAQDHVPENAWKFADNEHRPIAYFQVDPVTSVALSYDQPNSWMLTVQDANQPENIHAIDLPVLDSNHPRSLVCGEYSAADNTRKCFATGVFHKKFPGILLDDDDVEALARGNFFAVRTTESGFRVELKGSAAAIAQLRASAKFEVPEETEEVSHLTPVEDLSAAFHQFSFSPPCDDNDLACTMRTLRSFFTSVAAIGAEYPSLFQFSYEVADNGQWKYNYRSADDSKATVDRFVRDVVAKYARQIESRWFIAGDDLIVSATGEDSYYLLVLEPGNRPEPQYRFAFVWEKPDADITENPAMVISGERRLILACDDQFYIERPCDFVRPVGGHQAWKMWLTEADVVALLEAGNMLLNGADHLGRLTNVAGLLPSILEVQANKGIN